MDRKRQVKNRSGVALFVVLFVMVFLGILMVQFFANSQHAQRTAHRFFSSEIARQLAAAGQEEAFAILHQKTDNPESKEISGLDPFFQKIVDTSQSLIDATNVKSASEDEGSKIQIPLPVTSAMADKIGMEIKAFARVIAFRKTDLHGFEFYGNEGIGTIEIVVNAKAKAGNEKKAPGSCNMIRHHDFRVACILSKASERPSGTYVQNSILDYVFFIKKGQKDYTDFDRVDTDEDDTLLHFGGSINPSIALEINAESSNGLGKVNLGSSGDNHNSYNSYQCLNISTDTIDLMKFSNGKKASEPQKLEFEIADDSLIHEIYPIWGKDDASEIEGKKLVFHYYREPIVRGFCKKETLDNALKMASAIFEAKRRKNCNNNSTKQKIFLYEDAENTKPVFFDGIVIKPTNKLNEILTSDVRKQFLNYGYFTIDLTNARSNGYSLDEIENGSDAQGKENIRQYRALAKKETLCLNYDDLKLDNRIKNKAGAHINYQKLTQVLKENGVPSCVFTSINNSLPYLEPSSENDNNFISNSKDFYRFNSTYKSYNECYPEDMKYPYAHINLWNKREMKRTMEDGKEKYYNAEDFGIYDRANNVLYLRGINHSSDPIVFGEYDNPSQKKLTIVGSGVLIAKGITINCGIEKANPNAVCVLYSRNKNMIINTKDPINAALICMGQKRVSNSGDTKNDDTFIKCYKELNLVGSLATDRSDMAFWEHNAKHNITYDSALFPNRDVYTISINKSITFERVMEKE